MCVPGSLSVTHCEGEVPSSPEGGTVWPWMGMESEGSETALGYGSQPHPAPPPSPGLVLKELEPSRVPTSLLRARAQTPTHLGVAPPPVGRVILTKGLCLSWYVVICKNGQKVHTLAIFFFIERVNTCLWPSDD